MPLKLVEPRKGKTPYWSIRGTHRGIYIDRSTKHTLKAKARETLNQWKAEIERGEFSSTINTEKTFLNGAVDYVKAGGDKRFISFNEETKKWDPLIIQLGEKPLSKITQEVINETASKLYPNAPASTRNRQVFTPASAVLKYNGVDSKIKRPKGWRGSSRVTWLWPERAFAVFAASDNIDLEFGIFQRMLCYTGIRLLEATEHLECDRMQIAESYAYLPDSKNGEPQPIYLPPALIAALANHPRGLERPGETVFRFRKCGRLYKWFDLAFERAGVILPPRIGFHVWRHTYGTWMRRYGGLSSKDLVETGRWLDPASAARYDHVTSSEVSRKADLLPNENSWKIRGKRILNGLSA